MVSYRIISEGTFHYVERGTPIVCYWQGVEPPMKWERLQGFHNYMDALQFISHSNKGSPLYSGGVMTNKKGP